MVNNTIYQFLGSNLGVEIYLKRREHQKKAALKIEASQYILYWGFKKMSFKLYIYVLGKILQDRAKFIQKLTSDFKDHIRNLENLRKSVESPKSWNLMGYFRPKNTFSQLKQYIQRVYLISPIISENMRYFCDTFLYFLAQTLHIFYKSSPSK